MHKFCNFNHVSMLESDFLYYIHLRSFQHSLWKMWYELDKYTSHSFNTRREMAHQKNTQNGRGGGGCSGGPISAARYLVLLGDVLLVILLHLPELGLQPTELDLHLLHVLQVPLGSLVQHLNGLSHVLDLWRWTDLLDGPTKSILFNKSLFRAVGIAKTQQTFSVLLWLLFLYWWSTNSDSWMANREPQTHSKRAELKLRHSFSSRMVPVHKHHKAGTSSIYVFIRCQWIEVPVCVNHWAPLHYLVIKRLWSA